MTTSRTLIPGRCQKIRYERTGGYQCARNAKRDGWCLQHHPDAVKARREESARRFEARMERETAPFRRLADKAAECDRIKAENLSLAAALAEARGEIEKLKQVEEAAEKVYGLRTLMYGEDSHTLYRAISNLGRTLKVLKGQIVDRSALGRGEGEEG